VDGDGDAAQAALLEPSESVVEARLELEAQQERTVPQVAHHGRCDIEMARACSRRQHADELELVAREVAHRAFQIGRRDAELGAAVVLLAAADRQ